MNNNVLIVDDEAAMRAALEASFRRRGWRVQTAEGVSEALSKFRSAPAALVVSDMRMPDGDGLQVMQGVRTCVPDTPVIFLTGYGSVPNAVQAIREGACDYLQKPVSFEHLEAAAERFLAPRGREERAGSSPERVRLYSTKPKQGGVFFESMFANELSPLKLLQIDFGSVLRLPIEITALVRH